MRVMEPAIRTPPSLPPVSTTPKVSIGLPVFNGESFLGQALDSLLGQSFEDFELIVSDNGSSDGTQAICQHHAERDARLRYVRHEENRGAAWNYNFVFAQARGAYFKWAAHDDVCAPTFLERCIEVYDGGLDSLVLVYPKSVFIDQVGDVLRPDRDDLHTRGMGARRRVAHVLRHVNLANAVFGLMRCSALERTRLIDSFVASDYVLFVELALLGEFHEIPEVLFQKREHRASSRMANVDDEQVLEWFDPGKKQASWLTTRQRLWLEYLRSARRLTPGPLGWLGQSATITGAVVGRRMRVTAGRLKRSLLGRRSARA